MTMKKPTSKSLYHRPSGFYISSNDQPDIIVKDNSGTPKYYIDLKRSTNKYFSKSDNKDQSSSLFHEKKSFSIEWLAFVERIEFDEHDPKWNFTDFIESTCRNLKHNPYADFLSNIADATSKYLQDYDEKNLPMATPSKSSFIFFLRYVPYFKNFQSTVYIESKNGRFGITIENGTSLLDLQVKDNSDLIFSYVKPGNNGLFPSISGEAVIDDTSDSFNIEKILRMIYE